MQTTDRKRMPRSIYRVDVTAWVNVGDGKLEKRVVRRAYFTREHLAEAFGKRACREYDKTHWNWMSGRSTYWVYRADRVDRGYGDVFGPDVYKDWYAAIMAAKVGA